MALQNAIDGGDGSGERRVAKVEADGRLAQRRIKKRLRHAIHHSSQVLFLQSSECSEKSNLHSDYRRPSFSSSIITGRTATSVTSAFGFDIRASSADCAGTQPRGAGLPDSR